MAFPPPPKPASLLGYHRILSPTAGVRVSPLCLGAMNFGNAWKDTLGECDKKTTFEILDYFYENGGNFIDTANNYQKEESETWIGEWLAARNNRDQMVIATKYTSVYPSAKNGEERIKTNFSGNHTKSLRVSVERSLKKLGTDYLDLLYVHWWDFTTSIPELMQSLHHLVAAGKILYIGISDTPAWIVSKANEYARQNALTQFSVYQGHWSAALRDFERDILPMCEAEGMGIAPWGSLGRGMFKSEEELKRSNEEDSTGGRKMAVASPQAERYKKVAKVLEGLAEKKKKEGECMKITSVALAYILHKSAHVFPIIGGRSTTHLASNISALSISLTDSEIDAIDAANDGFDIGFPMNMLFGYGGSTPYNTRMTAKDNPLLKAAGEIDVVEKVKAIKPRNEV